jgi:hypothetical protein
LNDGNERAFQKKEQDCRTEKGEDQAFLRVTMRIEAKMAKEAVPRKINHWKMILIFCSNMETLSRKSIALTLEGHVM